MENRGQLQEVVLLFDDYRQESQKLHTSFQLAGKEYPTVVIEETGFLPENVISVFGFFLGDFKKAPDATGKPRYFNQITIPEFWEISADSRNGKIYDVNKERGRIFYTEPSHKRLIKVVDWLDDRGVVRYCDHYNQYGALYARTVCNKEGKKVNKTYFSADGKEILMENYVTRDIILNDGNQVRIFSSLVDFVCFFLERAGLADRRIFFNTLSTSFFVSQRMPQGGKGDILFWQESVRPDIPGNMKVILEGRANRANKIMVGTKSSYEKLLSLGASSQVLHSLGYLYSFEKENANTPNILICTNSDRIAQCETLVKALPQMQFHIAAITEMSSKLMRMGKYSNVKLYPNVKTKVAEELFDRCDFYLDINYEGEILSAVWQAFLHNHLILGFSETLHNKDYIAKEHCYTLEETEQMIDRLKAVHAAPALLEEHLQLQHKAAMLEKAETYQALS